MMTTEAAGKAAMRILLIAAGILASAWMSTAARAQNYPWCAYLSTGDGTATNCGFITRQQCVDSVSGIGGYCTPNNQYVPPPSSEPRAAGDGHSR
jgi:hypothetical protein